MRAGLRTRPDGTRRGGAPTGGLAGVIGVGLAVGLAWGTGCQTPPAAPPVSPPVEPTPVAPEADGLVALDGGLRGRVLGAREDRPVLVALHGRGDHPERFVRLAEGWADVAHVVVPAAPTPYGSGFSWFQVRARQDDATLAAAVEEAARRVVQLVHARRSADHPVVVTGFSQGGMLSFALATRRTPVVDAAVPMGGFLPRGLWPVHRVDGAPPIVAVHGEADAIIPVEAPRATVAHLESLGWPVTLHTEPGVEHSISRSMRQVVDAAVRDGLSGRATP